MVKKVPKFPKNGHFPIVVPCGDGKPNFPFFPVFPVFFTKENGKKAGKNRIEPEKKGKSGFPSLHGIEICSLCIFSYQ